MSSTYSPSLKLELIQNGEQSGTWGTTTNVNLGQLLDPAIAGEVTVTGSGANVVLTSIPGAPDQARNATIVLDTTYGAAFNVFVPPVTKLYVIKNESGYTATVYVSTSSDNPITPKGTGIAIPNNRSATVRSDGTNIVDQLSYIQGNLDVAGVITGDVVGTLTGSVIGIGPLTGNLIGNVSGNLTGNVTGNLNVGTGSMSTTNFSISEIDGALYVKYNGINILKIDSAGNLTAKSNLTAYGTV
jgi:hypothetical protein